MWWSFLEWLNLIILPHSIIEYILGLKIEIPKYKLIGSLETKIAIATVKEKEKILCEKSSLVVTIHIFFFFFCLALAV